MKAAGVPNALAVCTGFFLIVSVILLLREEVVPYRPGQWASHDIVSRVRFAFQDKDRLAAVQQAARDRTPRVYRLNGDVWQTLEEKLLGLPDRVALATTVEDVPDEALRALLDSASLTKLKEFSTDPGRSAYAKMVAGYVRAARHVDEARPETGLFILPAEQREIDLRRGLVALRLTPGEPEPRALRAEMTFSTEMKPAIARRLEQLARDNFELVLRPKIVSYSLAVLGPTHLLDEPATAKAQNDAAAAVSPAEASVTFEPNQTIVPGGSVVTDRHWQILRAENDAFSRSIDERAWKRRGGITAVALILTIVTAGYVARFQHRVVRKPARAVAIAGLLVATLLVAQLAGIGSSPLFFFGIAPTILVAMILAIAYDQRFAMGVAALHAMLVTVAVGEGLGFFLVLMTGVLTCCFLMDDVRSRSKLIEVGGCTALAMIAATAAIGLISMDPLAHIARTCFYTGAAGFAVGFVVLGILPFVEKAFRITTSIRLLELADASHPLLRRLSMEAPGTHNHSLQVGNIAEAAADAIGVNALLCRVASYYHDVGKINKAEYFIENQQGCENRHLNLSPSVSLLIIIGHVKDGVELAKEYDVPTSIIPIIQQHHGTTLVEYFYHRACNLPSQQLPDAPTVSETQYRYPGPKPRTKESAIVMIADAVESATRSMPEPTAGRVESLVHDIVHKRLLDGQFDECDLTLRDLAIIEKTCVKTLLGIYHGRIAYPSNEQTAPATRPPSAKSA